MSRKKTAQPSWRKRDPDFKQEKQTYRNPIPSRRLILQDLAAAGRPQRRRDIIDWYDGLDRDGIEAINHRLTAMLRDGQLFKGRRGQLDILDQADCLDGEIQAHPDGFGFLLPDDPERDDIFLTPRQMQAVMHGDRVRATIVGLDHRGREEGQIVQVLKHAHTTIVGRFVATRDYGHVVPDNRRITHEVYIPAEHCNSAKNNQVAVAELVKHPNRNHPPLGKVVEILGDYNAPGMASEMALRSHDIPHEWPSAALKQAQSFSNSVQAKDCKGRKDLCHLPFVTIDGADAKDFDDAVFARKTPKGWHLWVAIADVSSYVAPDTPLDEEAQQRGNSVYFPDQVVPMLPEVLSNGLCSLNPNVKRLSLVCDMQLTADGQLRSSRFYSAVIQSHARLRYAQVADWLHTPENLPAQYAALRKPLQALEGVYDALAKARESRGAIAFETTATKIIFNAEKKIERVVPEVRNVAHKIIEECMIAANVAAAKKLTRQKIPCLYRVHHGPKADSLEELRNFLAERGLTLTGGEGPEAKDFDRLLQAAKTRTDFGLIQTVLLRSMTRAMYSPKHEAHFGLALEDYVHFTSPIRRYPDLLVHRALKHLEKGGKAANFAYTFEQLEALGQQCSAFEERADNAARDVDDWLKCEYLSDAIGQTFAGTVVSVTGFGLFVELDEVQATGLVHVSNLRQDFYEYDAQSKSLVGSHSGRTYQLADAVQVRVMRVDLEQRKIDFELVKA